jgi:hypothetical protein
MQGGISGLLDGYTFKLCKLDDTEEYKTIIKLGGGKIANKSEDIFICLHQTEGQFHKNSEHCRSVKWLTDFISKLESIQ